MPTKFGAAINGIQVIKAIKYFGIGLLIFK